MTALIRLLIWSILISGLAALAGWALLSLSLFKAERVAVGEFALGYVLDRPVRIDGDVAVAFRPAVGIAMTDLVIRPEDREGADRLDSVTLAFSLPRLLAGRFEPIHLEASGLRFTVDARQSEADRATVVARIGRVIRWLFDERITPTANLKNVSLTRVGDPDGWNDELTFADISVVRASGEIDLRAVGRLRETPIDITVDVEANPTSLAMRPRPFALKLDIPNARVEVTGSMEPVNEILQAHLEMRSSSLTEFLAALGLRATGEATGRLQARIAGSYGILDATDIAAAVDIAGGQRWTLTGEIGDLWSLGTIGVDVAATFPGGADVGLGIAQGLDLQVLAARARVEGTSDALTIRDLRVTTDVASTDLQEIGPIKVGRLVRDSAGRLGVLDLRLVQGEAERRIFDLDGEIRDVIALQGISIAGRFDLDAAAVLSGIERPDGPRLRGDVRVSDTSGVLQIDDLQAAMQGSDAFTLSIDRADATAPFRLAFDTPDLDRFATTLGRPPIGGGRPRSTSPSP